MLIPMKTVEFENPIPYPMSQKAKIATAEFIRFLTSIETEFLVLTAPCSISANPAYRRKINPDETKIQTALVASGCD